MISPAPPPPDDKDWTWVLNARCPDCGFDARAASRSDLPELIERYAAAMAAAVTAPDATQRPRPHVWSPLEYGCHVRDVCRIFAERVALLLRDDNPLFANWDQDSTALADRYWEHEPTVVAQEIAVAASEAAALYRTVTSEQWHRSGRRSNGSTFTVESLGRYFVHDLAHHAHDVN